MIRIAQDLVHFGRKPGLTEIDPSFIGTGSLSFRESQDTRVPVSFYYFAGTEPERLVMSGASARYETSLPSGADLLDLASAPPEIGQAWRNGGRSGAYQVIKDMGYFGFFNSSSALPNAAAVFYPLPVRETEMRYDTNLTEDRSANRRYAASEQQMEDAIWGPFERALTAAGFPDELETASDDENDVEDINTNPYSAGLQQRQLVAMIYQAQARGHYQRANQLVYEWADSQQRIGVDIEQVKQFVKDKFGQAALMALMAGGTNYGLTQMNDPGAPDAPPGITQSVDAPAVPDPPEWAPMQDAEEPDQDTSYGAAARDEAEEAQHAWDEQQEQEDLLNPPGPTKSFDPYDPYNNPDSIEGPGGMADADVPTSGLSGKSAPLPYGETEVEDVPSPYSTPQPGVYPYEDVDEQGMKDRLEKSPNLTRRPMHPDGPAVNQWKGGQRRASKRAALRAALAGTAAEPAPWAQDDDAPTQEAPVMMQSAAPEPPGMGTPTQETMMNYTSEAKCGENGHRCGGEHCAECGGKRARRRPKVGMRITAISHGRVAEGVVLELLPLGDLLADFGGGEPEEVAGDLVLDPELDLDVDDADIDILDEPIGDDLDDDIDEELEGDDEDEDGVSLDGDLDLDDSDPTDEDDEAEEDGMLGDVDLDDVPPADEGGGEQMVLVITVDDAMDVDIGGDDEIDPFIP